MTTFIQLHLLTAYPAANLNRDDTGAPKTVVLGGATRLRVSSQSLKRAWRTSALFEQALAGHIGIRSGRIAREAATILIEKGIEEKKAIEWAAKIADYLGKAKNDKKPKDPLTNAETEQLVHISPAEFDAVKALAHQLAEEKNLGWLDVNELFDDENGNLNADLSADGAHVLGKYYADWSDWILQKLQQQDVK